MPPYQLRLTGLPSVTVGDAPAVALSLREAALLAWLHLEGPTPRSRIAGLLWPDGTEPQARTNLRQTLARLRRGAGPLVRDDDGVLSLADGVAVDTATAGRLLGPLDFDSLPELAQWLAARREDHARQHERQAAARGQRCLEQGDADGALAAADELLAAQPENETAWRLRMEAHYQRGDRAAAIAAWDACRLALRSAFGIAPSAATNELGRLILASDAAPAAPAGSAAALPSALRRPPRLVGREALSQALARHLALGGSALLGGPGGMGKSRLLQQMVADPRATLWVGVRPGAAVVPGSVIGQLLGSALESFAPALDPDTAADVAHWLPARGTAADGARADGGGLRSELAHRRAVDALGRALAACHAQGLRLLVVDDLQFADDASLDLLHTVLGRWLAASADATGAAPQVLLGARSGELSPAGQALRDALAGHALGRVFEVPPLDHDGVEQLVASLELPAALDTAWGPQGRAALALALHGAVGGSPAHVLEALRHLAIDGFGTWSPGRPLPVPSSLVETMRRRVERLPADALQLAQLAAVAQGDFDIDLAEATFGRPALALGPAFAALEAAWVFDGARFSHDLVAEAVRSLLPRALVAPLHRRVAEHLAARGRGDAARVAHHFRAAGAPDEAAPWLVRAGVEACRRWQIAEAAQAFAEAAQGFDATSQREQALDAWCRALRCWIDLRRHDAVAPALAQAALLPRRVDERARLRAREVQHLFQTGRTADAVQAADTLADELAACGAQLDAGELVYGLRSVCLAVQGGMPAARVLQLCERVQPRIVEHGGEALAGFALARAGTLLWDGQPQHAAAELEAAWASLAVDGDPLLRRSVGNQLMRVRQALGDLDGAVALGHRLLAAPPGAGDAGFEADVLSLVSMMQVARGEAAPGLASIERLCERLRAAGEPMRELYAISIALSHLTVGRPAQARRWLDEHTSAAGREGHALIDYPVLVARARLAAACGEPVAPWIERIEAVGPLSAGGELHRQVALAALRPADPAALDTLCRALRERGQSGLLRTVEIAAARAALDACDHERAAGHARAALALAGCVDAWSDQPASVWLHAHDVLAACGAADEARAALADGVRWVERSAGQWSDAAAREAWRHGNRVHRALLDRAARGG